MRARNIKPGFFENEQLAELPFEARLLFAGLWCYADREGRFEWRPKRIKALLFPYDVAITPDVIECHLMSLHVMTLILQYKSEENLFGLIKNFKKHQKPHPHEAKSILPDPFDPSNSIIITKVTKNEIVHKAEENQCHEMSVKCQEDIMIPDCLIPKNKNILSGNGTDITTKTKIERVPYAEIVEYLNQKTGKKFAFSSKETQRHIKARWNEGFRLEHFQQVINTKVAKWASDPKMVDYLRPKTLFGSNFESYLNEIESTGIDTSIPQWKRELLEHRRKNAEMGTGKPN